MKFSAVVLACLLSTTSAINLAAANGISTQTSSNAKVMEEVFMRSGDTHKQSMESILNSMSLDQAVQSLEKSNISTPELMQVADMAKSKNLRAQPQPKGYKQLDGTRKLLNDMIYQSMEKYDAEVVKCTDYYSKQCGAMEGCRGQIAASNFIAAVARELILDSQAIINQCEVDIPTQKLALKQHELMYTHELSNMNKRLKIVIGDIGVMTMILKMTDCDNNNLIQMEHMSMMHCTDKCTKKSFVQFNDDGLQNKINKLQSSSSHELMQDTFKDLFAGIEGLQSTEFLQTDAEVSPVVNKTKFNTPAVPKTPVPANPCSDPGAGGPSGTNKRAAKCTLGSTSCYKLQERFMLIQSGIGDEKTDLEDQIGKLETDHKETKKRLSSQISEDEDALSNAQTKLAAATSKEATAGEKARHTATENSNLNADLLKQMKTCSENYMNFESEMCALKKIRGELYKMQGKGHLGLFQDCEVDKWVPQACSKTCDIDKITGGEQNLTRKVLTQPNGGAKCLPSRAMRSCNNDPCPVDCKVSTWNGWSKCSAQCGGGVSTRLREVKVAEKNGGKTCGGTLQEESCNNQACEKDCELTGWTKWSTCSKDCDGGTAKRQKFVKTAPEGAGECPDSWSMKRLEYKKCNNQRCVRAAGAKTLTCDKKLDIVLLIDGSGSLGKRGWTAEIKAAQLFVDAFRLSGNPQAQMSVILYSGPRSWSTWIKCFSKKTKKEDRAGFCNIKNVIHLTSDLAKVKKTIAGLKWPKGSTLTSMALLEARTELTIGRADAQSDVIVFTDGKPMSPRSVGIASHILRKSARLLWVPVTRFAPRQDIKHWATRNWYENVVFVPEFSELGEPTTIDHIIADICPKQNPKMVFPRH